MTSTTSTPAQGNCDEVDFQLDEFDADEEMNVAFYHQVAVDEDLLVPFAEHHTADGAHSYYVLFDRSATYGHPGDAQYVAVHLQRDREKRSFDFEHASLPLPAMAQSWLIHRGCPPDAIGLDPELGPPPADEATRALGQRLVGDGDHYAMGYSYTQDDPDDWVTVVALRSLTSVPRLRTASWSRRSTPTRGPTPCARAASTPSKKPSSGATTGSAARPALSLRCGHPRCRLARISRQMRLLHALLAGLAEQHG